MISRHAWMSLCRAIVILAALSQSIAAQAVPPAAPPQKEPAPSSDFLRSLTGDSPEGTGATETPPWRTQVAELAHAMKRLPVAAGLACVLALRPRRRGTPKRQPAVVQTQIILAVVGAVVMLVVGSSLARAFGIVGAAGLVRYRAKIADPKDAGVMLSTLAVGLAAGVGLWLLATFGAAFILGLLWIIESFEPKAREMFELKVKAKDPAALKPKVDQLLARHNIRFELRTSSPEEISYEVALPFDRKTDRLSTVILALDPQNATAVEWEEKKVKS
jgi:uncharacterized membrane protein YhiD involved in acid resistance